MGDAPSEVRGAVAPDGRRRDDIALQDIWRLLRRGRWLVAFSIAVGTGGGWLGGQVLGPVARSVVVVDGRITSADSVHTRDVGALRATDVLLDDRINQLAEQTKLTSYLICTFTRRNDPAAVPPECNQVILDWRRGLR